METAVFERIVGVGSVVIISGRRYIVDPTDIMKVALWPSGTEVEIEESKSQIYGLTIRRRQFPHEELRANAL
jgi:hypothetical protein